MNIYLKEQLLIHLSGSAKEVMQDKGHQLKKNMPRNVSSKNALRIARYRTKNPQKTVVDELQELLHEKERLTKDLERELASARRELRYYHEEYGVEHPQTEHEQTRKRLRELTHLQDELLDQQLQAKELLKEKKISHEEYEKLISRLEVHQDALRKKKQKVLLGTEEINSE